MTYPPYPQQPQYPPQQPAYYPPQPQYQQPPAYYPPQQHAAAPPPPVVHGTLDGFFEQPAGGAGKSITFDRKAPGTTYTGVVVRTLTDADIQAQTDIRDRSIILKHPDGRPKLVMIIPLQMQPSQEFPDGRAAWYVKGADRTELERAMEAAGCKPGTAPEAGAIISIKYVGDRPIPNLNPQKVKQVTYQRPANVPSVQGAQDTPAPFQQPGANIAVDANGESVYMPPQYAQQPQYAPPAQPQFQAPPAQPQFQAPQYAPSAPPAYQPPPVDTQQYMQPAATVQQPAMAVVPPPQQSPLQAPPDLSPDQQALLARLTGQ